MINPVRHLILGGQRSGKSRYAEQLAVAWCAQSAENQATLVATAEVLPGDEEMRQRVRRHQQDRAAILQTAEVPLELASFLEVHSAPRHLLVVDCLTLWLTQWLMPAQRAPNVTAWAAQRQAFVSAVRASAGPVIMVSNEIGLGVMPLGRETRHVVDELGRLHQALGQVCEQVSLMVAGLPLSVKSKVSA